MAKMKKETMIKNYKKELDKIFVNLDKDKKSLCDNLIQNAAFISATMDKLQEDINTRGEVISGINGNGFDVSTSNPSISQYNTCLKNYQGIIKTLLELLPNDSESDDEFAEFLNKGKPI